MANISNFYQVVVKSKSQDGTRELDFEVKGILPQSVSMGVKANWTNALPQLDNNVVNLTFQEFREQSIFQRSLTAPIWSGTSHMHMGMTIRIQAEKNSSSELIEPLKKLYKISLPRIRSGERLLTPPGPSFDVSGTNSDDNVGTIITIYVANFLKFEKVIITDLTTNFDTSVVDRQGLPMSADINISFRSYLVPIVSEMENILTPKARDTDGGSIVHTSGSGQGSVINESMGRILDSVTDRFGDAAEDRIRESEFGRIILDRVIPF